MSLPHIRSLEEDPKMQFTKVETKREAVYHPFSKRERVVERAEVQMLRNQFTEGRQPLEKPLGLERETRREPRGDALGPPSPRTAEEFEDHDSGDEAGAEEGREQDHEAMVPDGDEDGLPPRKKKSLRSTWSEIRKAGSKFRRVARQGNMDETLALWKHIKEVHHGSLDTETMNTILYVFADAKMAEVCQEITQYMKDTGIEFNSATYSIVIRLEEDPGRARQLLDEAKEKGFIALRNFSYLLIKYAASRDVAKTMSLYKEIELHALKPDDIIFHALFRSLRGSEQRHEIVEKVFEKLRSQHFYVSEEVGQEIEGLLTPDKWEVHKMILHPSGKCPCCSSQMEALTLTHEMQSSLRDELKRTISRTQDVVTFGKFQAWLKRNGPFDVIVDGLNVGFASRGLFVPANITKVVNHFEKQGLKVGVLIKRHALKYEILQNLQLKGQLFSVSHDRLDDLYWMYAAVYGRPSSGMDILCVTNDKLRDHHQYLDPSRMVLFTRWKLAHRVEYDFVGPQSTLQIFPRLPYYRIAQKEGQRWHIPLDGEEWLCVRKL